MSAVQEQTSAGPSASTNNAAQPTIPPWGPVSKEARELWEDNRPMIEAKAAKYFPMPVTFQIFPLKMSVVDMNGVQTYFFKARVPNNRFVNVRLRMSGDSETREDQIAVESHATPDVNEPITTLF